MNDNYKPMDKLNEEIDKYQILRFIFDKARFRYNDDLFSFKKKLTDKMDYEQLDLFNTLFELIKNNVLENVAGLLVSKLCLINKSAAVSLDR